jgi:hypothetical protein
MRGLSKVSAHVRRLLSRALALVIACMFLFFSGVAALAWPTTPPALTPAASTTSAHTGSTGASSSPGAPVGDRVAQAALNSLIDPALLQSLQQSIVGLVILWEEPETDPFAFLAEPTTPASPPAVSLCTGWFSSESEIVTAGHCVDPVEGRRMMDWQNDLPIDPTTGEYLPPDPVRPEPVRTVYAFQPRELAGAVITEPTIVRVDSFRPADEGDTAKLNIYGVPPAKPLPIAPDTTPDTPRLGDAVTSIGFPGLNITETDGINLNDLLDTDTNPAKILSDSRLQPVSTSGTITSQQYRNGVVVYQTNADLDYGTSGGPTVNSRGQVLGVNSMMTIPLFGQNFNIITDTGMLREFLGNPGQPTPATTPASTPTQHINTTNTPDSPAPTEPTVPEWLVLLAPAVIGAILGAGITRLLTPAKTRHQSTTDTEKKESGKEKALRRDPAPANTENEPHRHQSSRPRRVR